MADISLMHRNSQPGEPRRRFLQKNRQNRATDAAYRALPAHRQPHRKQQHRHWLAPRAVQSECAIGRRRCCAAAGGVEGLKLGRPGIAALRGGAAAGAAQALLGTASAAGDVAGVQRALVHGADPNQKNPFLPVFFGVGVFVLLGALAVNM